jgi:DNA-binding MarR family transcriptional regulator
MVSRWEARVAFPTAARLLEVIAKVRPRRLAPLHAFFSRVPASITAHEPTSPDGVAAFLSELRGKTPLLSVARATGFNRYSVSRWLSGAAEPRLPCFLQLVDVMTRRLPDFLACCTDPLKLGSVAGDWRRLEAMRETAYATPWSHAVLRALELEHSAGGHQVARLQERLGISKAVLDEALAALERTQQIAKTRGKWRLQQVVSVNTAADRQRAHALKLSWTRVALERMSADAPGNYGYSLFAASKADLRKLREVHLEYVRAMQQIIAASKPGECVGLYCAQLLDLGRTDNALDDTQAIR